MANMETAREVARALIAIGAIGFSVDKPVTFASGIVAPVYVDNRKFPFHPAEWTRIINGFADLLKKENLSVEVIAGVEAAGIPHSAALGFHTNTPSVFIRKKPKGYGMNKLVEGGNVSGKKVVLVEDLVTTGGSSLNAVRALQDEGAKVTDVIVIVTYGFPESVEAFKNANVTLHSLTSFPIILEEAQKLGKLSSEDAQIIEAWAQNPHHWREA